MGKDKKLIDSIASQHRKLFILQFLDNMVQRKSNMAVLKNICCKFGLAASSEVLKLDIQYLKEREYISLLEIDKHLILTLTEKGSDISNDLCWDEEIKRPLP